MGFSFKGRSDAGAKDVADHSDAAAVEAAANAKMGSIDASVENAGRAPDEHAQGGVQQVEAMTLSWSKSSLIAVFANIWFLYLVNAWQSAILSSLLSYATSDFDGHSLLNVIPVVSSAMTAAMFMPVAKLLDIWGRPQGFAIMVVFATLGLIITATSHSIAALAAANVFTSLGFSGIIYCCDVVTADVSTLRNRALAYAFTSSPYMITSFAGPAAAEAFQNNTNLTWRWGFGIFAIILPIVSLPLFFVLQSALSKAKKNGTLQDRPKSGRTLLQSIWYYIIQFDAAGVILFSIGLTVFLLPFNIAALAADGWSSGYIIAMIVLGVVFLGIFFAYETWIAPVPLLGLVYMTDRTVIGACLINATYQISYYCWNNLFTSFLQVVNDLSIANAGYVNNTFTVVSGFLLFGVGFAIRRTNHYKWLLYIGVPIYIFSQGLMIYFRKPDQSVGYLIMCQVLISIGGNIFIIVCQLAILAAVDHQHVATALALLNVVGTVGGAMGGTISGAIWTNTFPPALERYLPESALGNLTDIAGDINVQLGYEVGSETRIAIQNAYGYAQTRMLAAGTGIMGLALIWMFVVRNINVGKKPQVVGTVF